MLRWIVAGSFLAVALWTLKPDTLDDEDERLPARGAFIATTIAFFLAEIGDKTQVATVLLAAKYQPLWQVVAGTTLGMLLANVPVVLLGSRFADRLPLQTARTSRRWCSWRWRSGWRCADSAELNLRPSHGPRAMLARESRGACRADASGCTTTGR